MTIEGESVVSFGSELRQALAASGTGTWKWDAETGVVRWDETMEALSGLGPGTFGSTFEAWIETLHPDEVASILATVDDAIARKGSYHFEHRTRWPDGTVRWVECRGQVTVDRAGNFSGTVGCAMDISARRAMQLERDKVLERERRLRDRLEFLATLTDIAIAAEDHSQFMQSAARAAVPKLGDWCSIHFVPDRGADIEIAVAHADASKVAWADELAQRFPYDPDGDRGVPAVLRTGQSELLEVISTEMIDETIANSGRDPELVREVLDELGVTSAITVPLVTKHGILGAMQFVSAESGRSYDADDLALTEVAAGRIADTLDNMWLTEQHRHISRTLQRALLPPALPAIVGVDVAVRYWPAGAAVDAGGDFYDVFQTGPDRWSILIGDICGTGADAAALTGIARHTVRAAARHGQDTPSVLEWLNEAMCLSNRDRFCTAAYATLERTADSLQLTTSAAGHPRPILARRGGASLIGEPGTLLGVFNEIRLSVAATAIEAGDVVVMYTDGVTDLPPPHGRTEQDIVDLVAELADPAAGRGAEEIADAIHQTVLERVPDDQAADDVALVVLRCTEP